MMLLRRWMRVASRRWSAVSANESVLATLVYRTGEVLYDFFGWTELGSRALQSISESH